MYVSPGSEQSLIIDSLISFIGVRFIVFDFSLSYFKYSLHCWQVFICGYTGYMNFHVITIFPKLFDSYLGDSIMKRAISAGHISVRFYDPRDFTQNKHNKVDDIPYGGGPGMIMTVDPIIRAWESARYQGTPNKFMRLLKTGRIDSGKKYKTIILSPGGTEFTTEYAKSAAQDYTDIIFICGRYEGIDARVAQIIGEESEEVSIGNYVLTGGELATMVMIDSISRQIDGVLGNKSSLEEERISSHEMYTRPQEYKHNKKTYAVPKVLIEGNHKLIDEWRESH